MPVLSVTRLGVRSSRFLPAFIWYALRSQRQARMVDGCLAVGVRREKGLVFWTRSAWRDEAAMRRFMTSGAHRLAMPKLENWCNEVSLVHWDAATSMLPDWTIATERLRREGRVSRVRYPSPAHSRGESKKSRPSGQPFRASDPRVGPESDKPKQPNSRYHQWPRAHHDCYSHTSRLCRRGA
jgi:hypothetical protein